MEVPPRLLDMPQEVLEMILEEYFKIVTLNVTQKAIPLDLEHGVIPEDERYTWRFADGVFHSEICVVQSSGKDGLSILQTCNKIYQASQRFLLPDFLNKHATFHFTSGLPCFGDDMTTIKFGGLQLYTNSLLKISCDDKQAHELSSSIWYSAPPFRDLEDVTVFYNARIEDDKPSLVPFRRVLVELVKACVTRGIRFRIFVKIDGRTAQKASIKAVVEGLEAKVYEMKQMTRIDLAFFRRLFNKLFECRLPAPDINWKRGQKIKEYKNEKMEWQDSRAQED